MEIFKKDNYYNSVLEAIIVNDDQTQDPDGLGRIQIFIPTIHKDYVSIYESYMASSSKTTSEDRLKFPWALPLNSAPKNGNVVYCTNIGNKANEYVILGLSTNDPANQAVGGDTGTTGGILNGGEIADMAMAIILQEEVGINVNDYPDNIPESKTSYINGNDVGCFSIGIVQWRASRAYDILFDICSGNSAWQSAFESKNSDLYNALVASTTSGNSSAQRNNFNNLILTKGTSLYNSVQTVLKLNNSKDVQINKAKGETAEVINILQNSYNVLNPALLIYMADIVNQYSTPSGFTSALSTTVNVLKGIANNGKGMIDQLNEIHNYVKSSFSQPFTQRRDRVYAYIAELEKQGKLNSGTLVDLGNLKDTNFIPENGEYLWPTPKSTRINCYWGQNRSPVTYSFTYDGANSYMGYSGGSFHAGTDFAPEKNGIDGDPLIAVGAGKVVANSYDSGAGNYICIQMNKNPQHYFIYMHLCKKSTLSIGTVVEAGEVVGYMGTTGNSTGTHLHLGLHIGAIWPTKNTSNRPDPLPLLGKQANA